jgi:hypothetical protein
MSLDLDRSPLSSTLVCAYYGPCQCSTTHCACADANTLDLECRGSGNRHL